MSWDFDPKEWVEELLNKIQEKVADHLLNWIMQKNPNFFKSLLIRLLEKRGYGIEFSV